MTQTIRQRRLQIQRKIMPYHVNPFCSDINLGTKEGLQLFLKATEPLEASEKFDLKSDKAKALIDHLTQVAGRFGWNKLIGRVMAPNYKIYIEEQKFNQTRKRCHASVELIWKWFKHTCARQ